MRYHCLECGHEWISNELTEPAGLVCPECGTDDIEEYENDDPEAA